MANSWVAIDSYRPRRATSFVAGDYADALCAGASRLGNGAHVTVVCDSETVEQAIERIRQVNQHSKLPSRDRSTTGLASAVSPRRVAAGQVAGVLPRQAEAVRRVEQCFGGDSQLGKRDGGNGS